jgi:hypothetical protein
MPLDHNTLCGMLSAESAAAFQRFVEDSNKMQSSMTFEEFVRLAQQTLRQRNPHELLAGHEAQQVRSFVQGLAGSICPDVMGLVQTELQYLQQPSEHVAVIFYMTNWYNPFVMYFEGDGAEFARLTAEYRQHAEDQPNYGNDVFPWQADADGRSYFDGFWIGSGAAFDKLKECFQVFTSNTSFVVSDIRSIIDEYNVRQRRELWY